MRDDNLDVQISWQAQRFVDFEVQISWQAQYFVDLEVQTSCEVRISWHALICGLSRVLFCMCSHVCLLVCVCAISSLVCFYMSFRMCALWTSSLAADL